MTMILPVNGGPVLSVPPATGISGPVDFHFSDRGFTTLAVDATLPNRHFAPRVLDPLTIERSLPLNPFSGSRVLLQLGSMALVNGDGGLDGFLRDYPIDGRDVEIKIGRPDFAYADFATLFKGTARSRRASGRRDVGFELRDITWRLEKPAQTNLFLGTGGLNGGPEIKGAPRPFCYGGCLNVTPTLVSASQLIFQANDGATRRIIAVYDRGLALTYAGDVADITAAVVAAGTYVTQLSGGYFRLGAVPDGKVTCDVEGDASFGTYVDKVADIAFRLISLRGGLDDSNIDPASFDLLRSNQPAPVGIFVGSQTVSVAAVLDVLFAGIGAWWGPNRFDQIDCGRVEAPALRPKAYFNANQVLDYTWFDLPTSIDPPWYRAQVGYEHNWTPQDSDFAGGVTAERRQFLAAEWRYAPWTDPVVQTTHLRAQDAPPMPSLFQHEADAQVEVNRLGALWGTRRSALRIVTKTQGYLRKLGETINLDLPVAPLVGGRNVFIIGQGIMAARNESTLDVMW
nr:hypothetical protein [uncultured Dongia sp.]